MSSAAAGRGRSGQWTAGGRRPALGQGEAAFEMAFGLTLAASRRIGEMRFDGAAVGGLAVFTGADFDGLGPPLEQLDAVGDVKIG